MPPPTFEVLDDVQKEIQIQQESWALVGEYSAALSVMTGESWLEYRAKILTFEDFLNAWSKRLKDRPRDAISEYLLTVCSFLRPLFFPFATHASSACVRKSKTIGQCFRFSGA